jgi:transposase
VKAKCSYRRYTAYQTEKLFELVIEEGKTAKEAALMIGINIRTAQHYIKKYHDDEEKCLSVGDSKKFSAGGTNKLAEEHSKFLLEYIDEHPATVLSKIRHHLCGAFPGLTISISAL